MKTKTGRVTTKKTKEAVCSSGEYGSVGKKLKCVFCVANKIRKRGGQARTTKS